MEKLNKTEDVALYLQSGALTQPFLSKEFVYEKVMPDLKHKHKDEKSAHFLESIYLWIHANVKYCADKEIQKLKFMRTAQEIWESKKASGCTDFAILYATFARQLNIPTTLLHTAEYDWLQKLKNSKDCDRHFGHSFCECYFNGEWVLVGPTSKHIERSYTSQKIQLSHPVGGKNVFVPYFRGLVLGKRQDTKAHNKMMDELCIALER